MKKIISDFRRAYRKKIIFYWAEFAVIALGLTLSGAVVREKTRIIAWVVLAGLLLLTIWVTISTLSAPRKFSKKLSRLPEKTREKILADYGTTKDMGGRWFLEEYVLFYRNRKIELLRYDEIRSAEPKGFSLELRLLDGKKALMPVGPAENPAVLIAALRSRNPQISAMLNGKVIEKMENKSNE